MDAGEHDTTQDPGWRGAWRGVAWMISPAAAQARHKHGDDLLTLRAAFVAYVVAGVGATATNFVLVSVVRMETATKLSLALVVTVVTVVGLVGLAVATRPVHFDCADDERIADSYRRGFFLRVAFAQLSTLLGYVGSLLTEDVVPCLVGAAISLVSLTRIAPTAAKLARDQQALTAAGCPRSLIGALRRNANRPPR